MILGELPFFKKPLPEKTISKNAVKHGRHIPLEKLAQVRVFHVTYCNNRESILQYGLLCKGQPACELISYEPRLFVSSTYEDAAFDYVHFEEVDVWAFYVDRQDLFPDESSDFCNHYYLKNDIPWYKLYLIETII